eukprot:9430049-Pyramimonas_sp.AAC.1
MAINFHGAYDKHVDEVQRAADDMARRIADLTRQNAALVRASDDVNENLKRAQDEVNAPVATITELNIKNRDSE